MLGQSLVRVRFCKTVTASLCVASNVEWRSGVEKVDT